MFVYRNGDHDCGNYMDVSSSWKKQRKIFHFHISVIKILCRLSSLLKMCCDSFDESAALLLEFVRCDERPDPNEIRNKRPKNDLNSNKLLYSDNPLSGNSLLNGMAPKINHVKNGSLKGKFGDAHETDEMRIAGRIKQILFGKNTTGYDNYISAVPK